MHGDFNCLPKNACCDTQGPFPLSWPLGLHGSSHSMSLITGQSHVKVARPPQAPCPSERSSAPLAGLLVFAGSARYAKPERPPCGTFRPVADTLLTVHLLQSFGPLVGRASPRQSSSGDFASAFRRPSSSPWLRALFSPASDRPPQLAALPPRFSSPAQVAHENLRFRG